MTRPEKFIRVPMIWKFLAGCGTLALLLILGGSFVVHEKTRRKSRGNYLEKHFRRYENYQAGLGSALSTVADLVASTPALRSAMDEKPEVPPAPDGSATAAPTRADATTIAAHIFEVLSRKNGARPDLMLLFDKNGRLVWAPPKSPVNAEDMRELEAVARVANGTAFFNEVLIHNGRAIQLTGVPIRSTDDQRIVGGLLLGVRLERYMLDYKEQSDSREKMKHRLSLVYKGKVIASVFPRKKWELLAKQLKHDNWAKHEEGDHKVPVIDMKSDGHYDFYTGEISGFAGTGSGPVATMYLMRSRSNLKGQGPVLPAREMVLGALLSLIIAVLLYFWITAPIKRFVTQSREMLEGETDLTQRITLRSRDETRELADNINQVFDKMYALATEVQSAAFHVGASSSEISAASNQMLAGLRDQTLKIEGSTAAVTELSASIQQVAANATEATKVAEKSNVAITSTQDRMQQIRSAVEDAADKMQELGESSKRIGNIVEVIRQISEQTSLLALNASIEAAHAGEQGRGFAVVADEVSSLARRVGQSAKDIETLIQTIKEQTGAAIRSVDVGTREVEGGTELVTHTLSDLQQLIAVVKDTAAAVQEQAMVSDEIARSMDAVQQIAGDVLVASEESVVQASQLHELAFTLERSVGEFNLDGTGSASSKRIAANAERRALPGAGE